MPLRSTDVDDVVSATVLANHLQEIVVEYESYKKQFRRAEAREAISIPVEAFELDNEFRQTSEPFHMVTRDISVKGAGMLHCDSVKADYLKLKFSSPVSLATFAVTARLEHCTPCGKYFIIGCRFLMDLDD